MLRSFLTASLFGALAFGGCDLSATCPCGARTSDPLSEHELGFGGSHEVDDECVCRCGLDTPFALPLTSLQRQLHQPFAVLTRCQRARIGAKGQPHEFDFAQYQRDRLTRHAP